jgi:hypothetical protein
MLVQSPSSTSLPVKMWSIAKDTSFLFSFCTCYGYPNLASRSSLVKDDAYCFRFGVISRDAS